VARGWLWCTTRRRRGQVPARRRHGSRQRQVRFTRGQFVKAGVPCPLAQDEGGAGIAGTEGTDQERQGCLAERVLERDGNPPPHYLRLVSDQVQSRLERREGLLDVRQQGAGGGCQPDSPAVPDQEFGTDDGARPGQRTAHRGLGYSEQFRGFRHVLGPSQLGKHRQERQQLHELFLVWLHGPASFLLPRRPN
jgi:hypothetical protein